MSKKTDETWKKMSEAAEKQRTGDRKMITDAFMKGSHVELKTLAGKRSHPFALENVQND